MITVLTFCAPTGAEQEFAIQDELSVGCDPSNKVVLRDAPGILPEHCSFMLDQEQRVWVQNHGYPENVLINGIPVSAPTQFLESDKLYLAGYRVILAKRHQVASPSPVRTDPASKPAFATRMMAAAEAPPSAFMPAYSPSGSTMVCAQRPYLRETSGENRTFELVDSQTLVGRVYPAQVLVDDDSVSRRHAQIGIEPDRSITLRDLGSANGTYVNGKRVSQARLSPGDRLRFGTMEFVFFNPTAPAEKESHGKKRGLLLAAAAILLVVAVVVVTLLLKKNVSPTETAANSQRSAAVDANSGLNDCRSRISQLNWAGAQQICCKLESEKQASPDAEINCRRAKKELANEQLLREAAEKIAAGQEEASMVVLLSIDKNSQAFVKARSEFVKTAQEMARRMKNACKSDLASKQVVQAMQKCQRVLELTCNQPQGADREAMALWQRAMRDSKKRDPGFQCPPEYAAFQSAGAAEAADSRDLAAQPKEKASPSVP